MQGVFEEQLAEVQELVDKASKLIDKGRRFLATHGVDCVGGGAVGLHCGQDPAEAAWGDSQGAVFVGGGADVQAEKLQEVEVTFGPRIVCFLNHRGLSVGIRSLALKAFGRGLPRSIWAAR